MTYLPDSAVAFIVLHYSATPIEHDVPVSVIDQWHRQRGFNEVGYHYYVRKDGMVERGRDLTQPGRFEQGAHSKDENSKSIGICYEGGVSIKDRNRGYDTRAAEQIKAMTLLITSLRERFPHARVEGHRDMPGASTQCPGFDGAAWWAKAQIQQQKNWLAVFIENLIAALRGQKGGA